MGCSDRCGFTACGCIGVLISVVFGAIIGVLFAFDLIPNIVVVAWIAFGLSILVLIVLISGLFKAATSPISALKRCLCRNGVCLLAGTIGALISSIIALVAIEFTNAFIIVIALVAVAAFFFALMIIGLIALLDCIICEMCNVRE